MILSLYFFPISFLYMCLGSQWRRPDNLLLLTGPLCLRSPLVMQPTHKLLDLSLILPTFVSLIDIFLTLWLFFVERVERFLFTVHLLHLATCLASTACAGWLIKHSGNDTAETFYFSLLLSAVAIAVLRDVRRRSHEITHILTHC
jgi:hypothetical protein